MQHHKSDKDFVLYLWKFLAVLARANAYFIHMIAIIFHPVTFWWYSLTHGTRFKDSRAKRKTLHGIIIQFNRYTWQDNNICINPNQNTSNLVQIKKNIQCISKWTFYRTNGWFTALFDTYTLIYTHQGRNVLLNLLFLYLSYTCP